MVCSAVKGQIGKDLPDDGYEFEAMAGESGGKHDLGVIRVVVDEEVLIRGHGVHAVRQFHGCGLKEGQVLRDKLVQL